MPQHAILVRYEEDFGRFGLLSGLFTCDEDTYRRLVACRSIYLGEALGKHSEVEATINSHTVRVVATSKTDPGVINWFLSWAPKGAFGLNLRDYLEYQEEAGR